jgi:peptide/nickel transport system substrate-binding protein
MKKLSVAFLVLLVTVLIVTGCSSGSSTTPAATTSAPSATTPAATAPGATTSAAPRPSSTTPVVTSTGASPTTAAKPTATGTPKYGGTMIDIESSGPGSPFGWPPDLAGGAGVTGQIGLDQLMHEDYKGNIIPNLATSWDVVTDPANPSITFHLRKGVTFHDGTDFNAQAVKWNLDMIKTGVNASTAAAWKGWDVIDDYTIRINLVSWQNVIIRNFTGITTTWVSPTAYQKNGVDYMRTHMVGTGAFQQVDYSTDVHLNAVKFAKFWDTGKPYLDGLQLLYVTDPLTRMALFKSGGGDLMGVTPKDAFDLQNSGYTVVSTPAAANVLIPDSMNPNSPWSNVKVRMAAEYAIDKEAMSKAFGYGYNPPAYQLAPSTSPAIVTTIVPRKYDVAKAKQLMTEAGFPNGFKTTIVRFSALDQNEAVAVQAYFKAIGIDANIQFLEAAALSQVLTGTWNGILFHQLRPFPNFNADLTLEFGNPTTFYKSLKKPDGWDAILKATLTSTTADPALMQKAEQALFDDCTAIPTTYYASIYATQSYVHDTGRGMMGSATQFTPYNAWLSK